MYHLSFLLENILKLINLVQEQQNIKMLFLTVKWFSISKLHMAAMKGAPFTGSNSTSLVFKIQAWYKY